MAQSNTTPVTIEIYRGSDLVSSVDRSEESITIGSGPEAALTVPGEGIGALHLVLNLGNQIAHITTG